MNQDAGLPAVIMLGGFDFQHRQARVWAEVASTALVRVVHKQTRRHRAWVTASPPPSVNGNLRRVTATEVARRTGAVLDQVRGGAVLEVVRGHEHRDSLGHVTSRACACASGPPGEVLGFIFYERPPQLDGIPDGALPYRLTGSRGGLVEATVKEPA